MKIKTRNMMTVIKDTEVNLLGHRSQFIIIHKFSVNSSSLEYKVFAKVHGNPTSWVRNISYLYYNTTGTGFERMRKRKRDRTMITQNH